MAAKKGKSKKGGPKMSQVKMKNIKGKKLSSGKKTKSKEIVKARRKLQRAVRSKLNKKGTGAAKEPEAVIEDVLDMIPSEDLSHLRNQSFRNNYYLTERNKGQSNGNVLGEPRRKKKGKGQGDDDELEEEYEHQFMQAQERMGKQKYLLPIKTMKGLHYPTVTQTVVEEEVEMEEPEVATKMETDNDYEDGENQPEVTTALLLARRKQKLREYKVRIGILSAAFLEDPENRLQNLESLLALMDTTEASVVLTVPKLAALSLQALFKDVLPLYPIKHYNPEGVKLKKDTRQLQSSEAALLKKYKMYMQKLEKLVGRYCPKRSKNNLCEAENKLGEISLQCMCRMLESHPYFNLSVNIVNFIVPLMNNWNETVREIVRSTLKTVFRLDKRGEISYEIVRRINILVKSKCKSGTSGMLRKDVLDILLALRIKEADLEKEKEEESTSGRKMTFEQRKMLSKRGRKKAKELVQLEKELLEASAEENKSRKAHFLTEVTKLVFTIYFRALKTTPRSQILSSVLEGLSKFAHVISVDYFEDLLKVLQGLLRDGHLQERQFLLCISTVLAVLDGKGAVLTLDPTAFHKHLYATLINLRCGKLQSNVALALRCAKLASGRNKMPGPRAVAFAKRLGTMALQVEHHDTIATVQQLKHVLRLHPSCSVLLDCEGAGANGVYLPELEDPDHSCAQASTLWEILPLMSHYHPWASNLAKSIILPEKSEPLPANMAQQSPEALAEALDDAVQEMEFIPKLKIPASVPAKRKNSRIRMEHFKPRTNYFANEVDIATIAPLSQCSTIS